jgi:ribonuclease P protein component
MLPSPYKFTKEDFEEVEEKGQVLQFGDFGASFLERGDDKPSRFGFIVSNKISKDATGRNRVKRALREAVRQSLWQAKKGTSVLFLAKTTIANKSTEEIMIQVRSALGKMGITK